MCDGLTTPYLLSFFLSLVLLSSLQLSVHPPFLHFSHPCHFSPFYFLAPVFPSPLSLPLPSFLCYPLHPLRLVCRDIGGSDPERMAAPRVTEYVQALFKDSPVQVPEMQLTPVWKSDLMSPKVFPINYLDQPTSPISGQRARSSRQELNVWPTLTALTSFMLPVLMQTTQKI